METHPIQCAKIIQHKGLTGLNQGLLHGNIGLCIFFYQLSRQTKNPDYEKLADELLDKIFGNLISTSPVDFENGLAGIGWGIEYLVRNNFANGDTDEILEEVDNKIFRLLIEDFPVSFDLESGSTGYLFYIISRLKSKKEPFLMAHRINRELLIHTINKLDELVTSQFSAIVKDMNFDLFWRFPVMLYSLIEAFRLSIFNEKIISMIRQWIPYFEAYIPSLHINRLFLAVALKHICSLLPEKRIEKQAQVLLFATDFEVLKTEIDHSVLDIRFGWPGAAWLLKIASKDIPVNWPNHDLIDSVYKEIIARHKNDGESFTQNTTTGNQLQYGLSLGLAGIGLMELLWPGVLPENYSLKANVPGLPFNWM